ncbi:MAG: molecular chaperone DnaJ [Rhodospirillales bacterium]|nr:molecular chaperone DnaJ [Rhodospirillales bacterium]
MLTWFLIGLLLLAVTVLLLKVFIAADPKMLARAIVWTASAILGLLFLYLAVTGRLSWLFVAIPALLPWFLRARMLARTMKTFARMRASSSGRPSGQTSRVESRYLRMTLDHDSGDMDGEVIAGAWAGRRLSQMSPSELIELLVVLIKEDPPSARLLEAYLDRMREGWRDNAQSPGGGETSQGAGGFQPGAMTRDEALRILGLGPGADETAIKAAQALGYPSTAITKSPYFKLCDEVQKR